MYVLTGFVLNATATDDDDNNNQIGKKYGLDLGFFDLT